MMLAIMVTIYFNNKNVNDSLLINIAGEQRMLTQKISKDIFYVYESKSGNYSALDESIKKFISNYEYIKNRDEIKEIVKNKNSDIAIQMKRIEFLWADFNKNVNDCKISMNLHNQKETVREKLRSIYEESSVLLIEVNNLVTLLTVRNENKNYHIKNLQYTAALLLLVLMFYIVFQLKHIEASAHSFIEYSKHLADSSDVLHIKPIHDKAEEELVEMDEIVQSFANKINSAIDFSNEALAQSEQASEKLEEIGSEFEHLLDELSHHTDATEHLNNSEDIVIESTEELINSTKKLHQLKSELDKLLVYCNPKTLKDSIS
jgi:methyl-accepting chemotaxis protein